MGLAIGWLLAGLPAVLGQDSLAIPDDVLAALERHCLDCHSGDAAEAELALDSLAQAKPAKQLAMLRGVLDAVDLREMPPPGESQPTDDQRQALIDAIHQTLRQPLPASVKSPPTPIRRMNRFQYNNAVTDLFELKCVVFTLPERMLRDHSGYFQPATGKMPDVVTVGSRPLGKSQMIEPRLAGVAAFPQDLRAEHGFDNQADHLSMSPLLMESFLELGRSITESPDFGPRTVGLWKSFFARPTGGDQRKALRARLRKFLTRAFRRPIDEPTLHRYQQYAEAQLDAGVEFTAAVKQVAAAVIASPRFLYLYDQSGRILPENVAITGAAGGVPPNQREFDLASRLSFFLWSSIPDERLLDLAGQGRLSDPEVLRQEATRMLRDKKLKRFCDSFPAQWLQLERIISATPNRDLYPNFYYLKYRDSMHMMLEPLLLFETVLIENQSIDQFLDSDFTYRSSLLEDAYGELASGGKPPAKPGNQVGPLKFRRVPIEDRRGGGLITNAAVMTMTSGTERTKPITRGAWMASVIFNHPPEPPPADVPPLEEHPQGDDLKRTLRERIALHRQRSDCRGCHEKIDPLGFALENYDVVGRWRGTYDNGRPVDMAGHLFGKHRFGSVVEFKDALLAERGRFARGLAAHLMAYALARRLEAADQPALDDIVETTDSEGNGLQTLILELVLSDPFRQPAVPPESAPGRPMPEDGLGLRGGPSGAPQRLEPEGRTDPIPAISGSLP